MLDEYKEELGGLLTRETIEFHVLLTWNYVDAHGGWSERIGSCGGPSNVT